MTVNDLREHLALMVEGDPDLGELPVTYGVAVETIAGGIVQQASRAAGLHGAYVNLAPIPLDHMPRGF